MNDNVRNFCRLFISLIMVITVIGITYILIFKVDIRDTKADVKSGIIVDKKLETVTNGGGLFRKSTTLTQYNLYVEYEYRTIIGLKRKGEKCFSISEEVYLAYKIDEFFDSQNFRKGPQNLKEEKSYEE